METQNIDESIHRLTEEIQKTPGNDELYRMRGEFYWKKQDWKEALDDFACAIEINPSSQAAHLREMLLNIISYYNKDMYNP